MSGQDRVTKETAAIRRVIFALGDPDGQADDILDAADAAIERIEAIEDAAESAEMSAQSALGVAQARDRADGGSTKKERVATLCRNELVRRALVDRSASDGAHVTVGKVKDMAKPELTVYQQTIEDAWDALVSRWAAFDRGENEAGNKALKIDRRQLDEELVGAVESDLDRDDLSKRLLRREESNR